jgi:hypothetical protein
VATAGDKVATRVARLAASVHAHREKNRERERKSNTENVTRLREDAREGKFPSLLVTRRRDLVATTRDGTSSRK